MLFSVSDDFSWRVGWGHPSWNLVTGQSVGLQMYFDGAGPYAVTAKAVGRELVIAELSSTAAIFDSFRKSYRLTVVALGNRYSFNLDGTFAALTEVLECTSRYAQAPAAPPPMVPARPTVPAPVAPAAPAAARARVPGVTAEQRLEATTLVANILAQGDLSNFRILNARERKALGDDPLIESWDVIWSADEAVGALRIVPKGVSASSRDLAAALLADDIRTCKGKFASGSMPDEKSTAVARLFTGCNDKGGSYEYRYTVVPLDEGGFYVFASIGRSNDGERPEGAGKADLLLRAAVYNVLKK
jgi:hypothetical protein